MHQPIDFVLPLAVFQILNTMPTGLIKFYNERKGYGFIVEDETQKEIFVHATGLIDRIRQEDRVEFDISEDHRGTKAINVKKI